jgi:hypothetical protein
MMWNLRHLLRAATYDARLRLHRLARTLALGAAAALCGVTGLVYLFSAIYQALAPLLGPAGANLTIGGSLVLIGILLLLILRRV